MPTLGEATVAELNALAYRLYEPPTLPTMATGLKSPVLQLKYLIGHLGGAGTARRLGVTHDTLRRWMAGGMPRKSNRARIAEAYHEHRAPAAFKRRQQEAMKKAKDQIRPRERRVQVDGTWAFSDDEKYIVNFGGTPRIPAEWWAAIIKAWRARKTQLVGDLMEQALQDVTGIHQAHAIGDDFDVSILAEN